MARDPISAEFFSTSSVDNAARSLIREAIQNSLDARDRRTSQVAEVRITVGAGAEAAGRGEVDRFFAEAWDHLAAKGSRIKNGPKKNDRCSFLTVEDFGTDGLEGDPLEWAPREGYPNGFYSFFRAEAYSEKSGDDRGRWGVGKLVFPRSSRARAFFGLTVPRSSGKRLLMGRLILPHHSIDGIEFQPDALFGVQTTVDGDDNFVKPAEAEEDYREFCRVFRLTRTSEPGLSVVVPWLIEDEDDTDQFEVESLARAVASEYLLPILRRELIVMVRRGSQSQRIDAAELLKPNQKWVNDDLALLLRLGRYAAAPNAESVFTLNQTNHENKPRLPDPVTDPAVAEKARAILDAGDPAAFDLPVRVIRKNQTSDWSRMRMHLISTGASESQPPVFVRDGITITNVRGSGLPGFLALVTIDHGPLATLLGDAENPAHTEWTKSTREFKDRYLYAGAYIDLVRGAPSGVFRALYAADREDDIYALAAFFPDAQLARTGIGKRKVVPPPPPPPPPPPSPRAYSLRRSRGGFELLPGGLAQPHRLRVRVAYDVRRGNPLRKYEPLDFDFSGSEIDLQTTNARLLKCEANEIVLQPEASDFRLVVSGFDPNRDLYVSVIATGDDYDH